MFEIKIEDQAVMSALGRLAQAGRDMSPVMRSISVELLSHTEANFEAEGRPKWLGLKPSTISMRTKRGTWPGRMLQVSAGGLAPSVANSVSSDASSATIGSNKVYAAMQQFGGTTSSRSMIPNKVIAPRPFLPVDAQGNLQPEAEDSILGIANNYLANLI